MEKSAGGLEAVFLDLDGSLLDHERRVGAGDLRTVRLLREQGVRVYLATGRHFELAARYHRELGLAGPFLASDGAMLYHPGEDRVLYCHAIPAGLTRDILRSAVRRGEEFYLHDPAAAYFSPNFGRMHIWQSYAAECGPGDRMPALGGLPEGYLQGEPEMAVFMAHLPSPGFLRELEWLCRGRAPLYIDPEGRLAIVGSPGWDKGRGARYLAEREGFSLGNALALGDTGNDWPILRAVGWPVSPENGDPENKALARFITTDNDHDPLTHAVRALFPQYGV